VNKYGWLISCLLMGLKLAGKAKPPVANDAKLFYYVFGAFIIHLSSLL